MPGTAPIPSGGCDSPSSALCSCWALALFSKSPPGPRGALVSPPAAHRAWPCAGSAPGPRVPPGLWSCAGTRGYPRTGVQPSCGADGKLCSSGFPGCWTGLPWGRMRVSFSPSQNFLFLLLFCFFNCDFLRRESLAGQHFLRWWPCCCKCHGWDIFTTSNLFSRALLK